MSYNNNDANLKSTTLYLDNQNPYEVLKNIKLNNINRLIFTAVSDVNKVEVSTLLNRNIDVNYQ